MAETAKPNFCLMLREKSGYFRSATGERLFDPASSTACYRCLLTQRPFGPDSMPVNPDYCASTRACFQSED
jgi:hypothetical protein